jgi:hypothetical protein
MYKLAELYDKREKYDDALKWYEKAAKKKHADAQFRLGEYYDHGKGVQQDYKKAANWYDKAAKQGHREALYQLSQCYKYGWGVRQNLEKAHMLYQLYGKNRAYNQKETAPRYKAPDILSDQLPNVEHSTPVQPTPTKVIPTSFIDPSKPIFKWQITLNNQKIPTDSPIFEGFSPIEYYIENGYYKYTYGASNDYYAIRKLESFVTSKFPQAFIIAFINGKRVNTFEAVQIFKGKR